MVRGGWSHGVGWGGTYGMNLPARTSGAVRVSMPLKAVV